MRTYTWASCLRVLDLRGICLGIVWEPCGDCLGFGWAGVGNGLGIIWDDFGINSDSYWDDLKMKIEYVL